MEGGLNLRAAPMAHVHVVLAGDMRIIDPVMGGAFFNILSWVQENFLQPPLGARGNGERRLSAE